MSSQHGNLTECQGATYVSTPSASIEMDAFEALGPATQTVIRSAPLKISAVSIIEQIRALGHNPLDAHEDRRVARAIDAHVRELINADRGPQEAMRKTFELQPKRFEPIAPSEIWRRASSSAERRRRHG